MPSVFVWIWCFASRLDTLKRLKSANALYEAFGFYLIEPYIFNPIEDALYFEYDLTKANTTPAT